MKIKISRGLVVFFLVILGLIPVIWFIGRGGVLITGSDTNFPLDPLVWFQRRFFVWNSIYDGGSDFSSSTAGIFFHLLQVIPYVLGLTLQTTELLNLIFWFSLIVFSSYFFARVILPGKRIFQMLFVVFYSINIYLFNTWENIKVANLALVAAIPAGLAIFTLLSDKKISWRMAVLGSAIVGIILSGSGINPAYFLCYVLIVFIYVLSRAIALFDTKNLKETLVSFLITVVPTVLVNLFWIIPTLGFVLSNVSSSDSISGIGYVNWINSLSENTSIVNVLRLQGAWDWYTFDSASNLPIYIPYAVNYFFKLPFLFFSFLIPGLVFAFLSLAKRVKNYKYLAFGIMLVLGVFLDAGTHMPTGKIYIFLSNHVPFFTLFRSPWYIFTPLITLSTAGILSLGFADQKGKLKQFMNLAAIVLIIGNLVYCYPLVTGKIFRPQSTDNFYIKFPEYVFQTRDWLSKNSNDQMGRVISYPEEGVERFKWGYNAVESILGLFSKSEDLSLSLNSPGSPISKTLSAFYLAVKKNEFESAKRVANALDSNTIFEKRDQLTLSTNLPAQMKTDVVGNFGEWGFYSIGVGTKKIYLAKSLYTTNTIDETNLSLLDSDSGIVYSQDSQMQIINGEKNGQIINTQNSQLNDIDAFNKSDNQVGERLIDRDITKVVFSFSVNSGGNYQPTLEKYYLESFGIDFNSSLQVLVNGNKEEWQIDKVTDSYVYYKSLVLTKGDYKVEIPLKTNNLIDGGDFGNSYLSLSNVGIKKDEPSVSFTPRSFDYLSDYLIKIKYKPVYGNTGEVVVEQNKGDSKINKIDEGLQKYPDWVSYNFYFEPTQVPTTLKVKLVAPYISDPFGTKVFYDDLEMYKVFSNKLFFVKSSSEINSSNTKISFSKVSPVEYKGEVLDLKGSTVIVFDENYSPDWQLTVDGKNVNAKHFTINYYANAWYLSGLNGTHSFRIYYKRQTLFNVGKILSVIFFVGFTSISLIGLIRRRRI